MTTIYTPEFLRGLDNQAEEGERLYLDYRRENGDRETGCFLAAFESTAGRECAEVRAFGNVIFCEDITGHHFAKASPFDRSTWQPGAEWF